MKPNAHNVRDLDFEIKVDFNDVSENNIYKVKKREGAIFAV